MELDINFKNRECITTAMEQVFVGAPEPQGNYLKEEYKNDPMLYIYQRVANFRLYQQKSFENIDWLNVEANLSSGDGQPSAQGALAYDYADMLLGAAIDDAQALIVHSMRALSDDILADKDELARVLIDNKNTLLQVALINEDDHRKIIHSSASDSIVKYEGGQLHWDSDVAEVIKQNRTSQEEGVGCPARSRVIDYQGRKTTLLNAFWESLVYYVFEP